MIDMYALPITFRYKSQKKFYTNYGALTSLIVICCVLGYLGVCFHTMFSYTDYTTTSVSQAIEDRPDVYGPLATNYKSYWPLFQVGIKVLDTDNNPFFDESYINVTTITN